MSKIINKPHFFTEINNIKVAYCYLRKNACSSWKNFILRDYYFSNTINETQIDVLKNNFCVKTFEEFMQCDIRIVVLRDPLQRLYSGYINQVIMRASVSSDVINKFENFTGISILDSTFNDFLTKYLFVEDKYKVDGHFKPQFLQMYPVEYYTNVLNMKSMNHSLDNLFGVGFSERYFSIPVNQTHKINKISYSDKSMTVNDYSSLFLKSKMLPDYDSLFTEQLLDSLKIYYKKDFQLLSRFL